MIQTTIVAEGSYADLTFYLQKLQSTMRRAVLIENIQLAKDNSTDAAANSLQMTLSGKVFILDTTAAAQPVTTLPATPAAPGTAN
jgi:hypothetical protein